ncbi:Protein of unknown function [Pyronema omphalodes CBS 100304]|uniref:Uncharacterized protein n=1 Tax=Pyronema omphalodes (strain CBS 100304) TaxID=1076935 RepID=U4LKJ6_PYROM|nr:Protein of unknown function [Pyronema omphalodes CBS 100304]
MFLAGAWEGWMLGLSFQKGLGIAWFQKR